jgi:thiol-disulfide isomerase/thioredoxin
LLRTAFLHGASAFAIGAAAPSPRPSPTGAPSGDPFDQCDDNPAIPYNRPVGLQMRVLDGPDFDLMKYRGYVVWINIFATWCPPCNHEQAGVVALAQKYYDRGLRVIGLNFRESDDTVRAYRKKYGIEFPIMMDAHGSFSRALQQSSSDSMLAFPAHLMFTPWGYLYCYRLGSMERDELVHKLEALMTTLPSPPPPGPIATATPWPTPTPTASPTPKAHP